MSKKITTGKENFEKLLTGFNLACSTIGSTLGPKGRNVYIDHDMSPIINNDGATIARYMDLPDKLENMGAKLVRNTCGQTNDDAGDGTTTTAVLLQAIVKYAIERPENPMEVRRSLLDAGKKILPLIKKQSIAIKKDDVKKVALISAEDEEIAEAVTQITNKLGKDACVAVEDSTDGKISYEIAEGYEAQCGFLHPEFVTDKDRALAILTDVPVLVTESKISTISDIQVFFNQCNDNGISQAVIVCDDIEDVILGVFVANKKLGRFNPIVIRATGDVLKDIEACVGATRVSKTSGVTFQTLDVKKHLGRCKKVISSANSTIFLPKDVSLSIKYSNFLQKFANEERNMFIKERLERRIAQLRGGIAILKVGSPTDYDREYLKLKAEDAIKAVKSALEEGVVEGGGMCLWRIAQEIKGKTIGELILKKALTAPLRKIIENAGEDYTDIVRNISDIFGYDAKNRGFCDLVKAGIIDPAKVERFALENSIYNAGQFITISASIYDYVEKKD